MKPLPCIFLATLLVRDNKFNQTTKNENNKKSIVEIAVFLAWGKRKYRWSWRQNVGVWLSEFSYNAESMTKHMIRKKINSENMFKHGDFFINYCRLILFIVDEHTAVWKIVGWCVKQYVNHQNVDPDVYSNIYEKFQSRLLCIL